MMMAAAETSMPCNKMKQHMCYWLSPLFFTPRYRHGILTFLVVIRHGWLVNASFFKTCMYTFTAIVFPSDRREKRNRPLLDLQS